MFKTYDIHEVGDNEYEVTYRTWHPLYWVQLVMCYLFGVAIVIDMPPVAYARVPEDER